MKVAIVGSRSFPQLKLVEWFIQDLPKGVTIVSGGAKGVDSAAAQAGKQKGLEVVEYLPDLSGCSQRHEFTERYYARNQKIVDASDLVVAFTEKEQGGTWHTIKQARKAGKPVKVIKPSLLFPGETEEEDPVAEESTPEPEEVRKGAGPFAIKRVSLGSYALRRKLYIETEEWADIVTMKDTKPVDLAEKMFPDFIKFFERSKKFGIIHAVTVPPRSTRNLDKEHCMDILASNIAEALGCEFVQMFEPWEKSSRGRFAKHGEITVLPIVKNYMGKVVWVLDDVTTTNFTLRAAVQSLTSLEIHAHGLAYVLMA